MDSRLLLIIIGLPIYLFLVIYFRRYRQWLLYYLLGAFGLTMLIALPIEYLNWDYYLVGVETFHVTLLGKLIGISGELLESGRILLQTGGGSSILKIGIECSGVLEAGVLIGLVSFYPVFTVRSKMMKITFGLAVTYLINILRMLLIIVVVAKFGTDYVFIAHAVVGRLFFFSLAIALYWYILTKSTLKTVGEAVNEGKLAYEVHHRPGLSYVIRRGVKIATTAIIAMLFIGSFAYSSDWRKAFSPSASRPVRPLIYAEETSAEPVTQPLSPAGRVLGVSTAVPALPIQEETSAAVPELQEEAGLCKLETAPDVSSADQAPESSICALTELTPDAPTGTSGVGIPTSADRRDNPPPAPPQFVPLESDQSQTQTTVATEEPSNE